MLVRGERSDPLSDVEQVLSLETLATLQDRSARCTSIPRCGATSCR